ncbi:MAG: hypothetical protein ACOZFS_11735 [Thermodesulfobacteriota bacterium]
MSKDLIFYVPRGQYDIVQVNAYIPTLANDLEGSWAKWKFNIEGFKWDEADNKKKFISFFIIKGDQRYPIYTIDDDGKLIKEKYPPEIKKAFDYLEYQGFRTSGMISIF